MKRHFALIFALALFYTAALSTLFLWNERGLGPPAHYIITGDEPHYLVMVRGLLRYHSLEQTQVYQDEITTRDLFPPGIAARDAIPSSKTTHGVEGPRGLYNIHGVGLPILLLIPFALGGVIGAKFFLVLISGGLVYLCWKLTGLFSENPKDRLLATLATTVAAPFIPATHQIYPDLPAGLLCLMGLWWFLTPNRARHPLKEIGLAGLIAFLPWLQIKLSITSLILLTGISLQIWPQKDGVHRVFRIGSVALLIFGGLALLNLYCYGKISGPYMKPQLEFSWTSVMVLLGLHLDQNQGYLMQDPIAWIGLFHLGHLLRSERKTFLFWCLLYLSLIVPNGLHWNWYGGGSLSGRFTLSAATVLLFPTIMALLSTRQTHPRLFYSLIGLVMGLQSYLFYRYAILGVSLFNKPELTEASQYAIFYPDLHALLPMLYNVEWAYQYLPNYLWTFLLIGILVGGYCSDQNQQRDRRCLSR